MLKHMRQVRYIAVQVASEVEDADNKETDTRTSAVPQEVPDTMTNAAPGSCTGSVQGNSGAPMRVPGSGLRATSGKVSGCSTPWALQVCVCVCSVRLSVCLSEVFRCSASPYACSKSADTS